MQVSIRLACHLPLLSPGVGSPSATSWIVAEATESSAFLRSFREDGVGGGGAVTLLVELLKPP